PCTLGCAPLASGPALKPVFEKIAHHRWLDIRNNHGTADRLEQDEGEPATSDLLVLRHQRHQRVGIGKAFLRKSGDILQMGGQTYSGKMALDAQGIRWRDHSK